MNTRIINEINGNSFNHAPLKPTAYVVGVTGLSFLSPKAMEAIRLASVVVGWQNTLSVVEGLISNQKLFIQDCTQYNKSLIEAALYAKQNYHDIALLVLDDPLVYSAGIEQFEDVFEGFTVNFVPSISRFQLAAAQAGISLENTLMVVFGPDKDGGIDMELLAKKQQRMIQALTVGSNLVISSDIEQTPADIGKFLLANNIDRATKVLLCEQMATAQGKSIWTDLGSCAYLDYHWNTVMVIPVYKSANKIGQS